MIRLFLGAMIIAGCTYLGIFLASSYRKRANQLLELQMALAQLEFDVDFRAVPLCESLENMGKNCNSAVRDVFVYIAERLTENRCIDMQRLWGRAVKRFKDELFLTDEDIQILLDFSKKLGSGDKEREKDNIKMATARLKMAEDEAVELAKKNGKMYRGLGVLAGVFIVIVLI